MRRSSWPRICRRTRPGRSSRSTAGTSPDERTTTGSANRRRSTMTDLVAARQPFINGEWVHGAGDAVLGESPATGEVVATVEGASPEQVTRGDRRGPARVRRGSVAEAQPRRTCRGDPALRRRSRGPAQRRWSRPSSRRPAARAASPSSTQVGMAISSIRELAELYARLPEWEYNEVPLAEHFVGSSVRMSIRRFEAAGVVAAITPVQLPAHHQRVEGHSGTARRMHGGAPAQPADAARGDGLRRGCRGGRAAAGRAQCRCRAGQRRRRTAHHAPRRRRGVLHRFDDGRARRRDAGGADAQARHPRARRQERRVASAGRLRGRGLGGVVGSGAHRVRRTLRTGLRLADTGARSRGAARRSGRRDRRRRRAI